MSSDQKEKKLNDIKLSFDNFVNSVYSLRNFAIKIGSLASKEDANIVNSFAENLYNRFWHSDYIEQLEEEIAKREEILESLDKNDAKSISIIDELKLEIEKINAEKTNELNNRMRKNFENDETRESFINEVAKIKKKSPSHSNLLRIGALTTLLSIFENFLSELIRYFYYKYPDALPSDARILSLRELKAMENIDDAITFITSKEVENILRGSIEDQIKFFKENMKIDLSPLSDVMNNLTEIFQRRNLLVHNGGVVNNIYLDKVNKDLSNSYDAKVGTSLKVTIDYLNEAIDIILQIGLLISQLCWRKWDKDEKTKADEIVIDILFDALIDENYRLIISVSKFFPSFKFDTDQACKVCSINVAIALKQLNQIDEMEKFLSTLDWSSASIKFDIALKALRNQTSELVDLIPKAIRFDDMNRSNLEEWPLFKEFRCTAEYTELLNIISK